MTSCELCNKDCKSKVGVCSRPGCRQEYQRRTIWNWRYPDKKGRYPPSNLYTFCLNCGKPLTGKASSGYCVSNTECARLRDSAWKTANKEKVMWSAAKARAKSRRLPFAISPEDIVIPKTCPILGIPLEIANDGRRGPAEGSPSLDRIIPELGYIPGNIQVISHKANAMKNNASIAELLTFRDWIDRIYGEH